MDVEANVEKRDFVVVVVSTVHFINVLTHTVSAGGCLSRWLYK